MHLDVRLEITARRKMKMNKYGKTVMLFTLVLAIFSAMSVLAQTDTTTPIRARQGVVDANGDGICDVTGKIIGSGAGAGQGQQARKGQLQGPGNGTGNGPRQMGAGRGNGIGNGDCTGIGRTSGTGRMNRGGRR